MGSGNSSSTKANPTFHSPIPIERVESGRKSVHQDSEEQNDELNLSRLTIPVYIYHLKSGNTLCSNDNVLLLQNGSTTIEFCLLPKYKPTKLPWRFGLIRDIVWCPDLNLFILLTRDSVFSVSPQSLLIPDAALNKPIANFPINTYKKIKPYASNASFWRCTCAGTTLYITYSGHGSIIDEYSLAESSCKFINRWTPPNTCGVYEGIWCVRHHPDTDQLGFTIMDARNNQWRMEIRTRDKFTSVWQTVLPISNGDTEISPLPNEEWLAINSCGIRLVQVANKKLKAAVEYERELRNAIVINNSYFAVRTKTTLEIHRFRQSS